MKKLSTLHILNGDASVEAFKKASLPGQVLVWREILSEGPAIYSLPEHAFWESRQSFITNTYAVPAAAYKAKVLDELPKLEAAATFFEVILWFDVDMMCQLNLLFLLQRLHLQPPTIISACTPPATKSIAVLHTEALHQLFENREQITLAQLKQAHELWQLYAQPHPMELQEYLHNQETTLPAMQLALQLRLQRFPGCTTGLNITQLLLLQYIAEGYGSIENLMQQFWKNDPGYGYGDWQLKVILNQLQPKLVSQQEPLQLTEDGGAVLQQKSKYSRWVETGGWLGGVQLKQDFRWCYNQEQKRLLKK